MPTATAHLETTQHERLEHMVQLLEVRGLDNGAVQVKEGVEGSRVAENVGKQKI